MVVDVAESHRTHRARYRCEPGQVLAVVPGVEVRFALRQDSAFNSNIKLRQGLSKYLYAGHGTETLGRHVFDRSAFHLGKPFRFVHPVPVIPRYLQVVGSVSHPGRKR